MKKRLTLIQMDVHVNDVEYKLQSRSRVYSPITYRKSHIIVLPETWEHRLSPIR